MKSPVGFAVACAILLAPVLAFSTWRSQIAGLTERVEQAGGFVGSVQPPDWMNPVYDFVCHLDSFCEPYQIILSGKANVSSAVEAAQQLPHLRVLEIEDQTIAQDTLDRIRTMGQLKRLEFRRCVLPSGGLDKLRRVMPTVEITEKN